ncbi:MAG TPA: 8-amino-7-oxononanoate synthase [Gammaproteobacteria bacterium]|nr:8-amino-7-oxononanoate synthase [Gammaproteobacteria bacterium]
MRDLAAALARRRQQGLYRRRVALEGAQGARVRIDGRDYLNFSSNDYLGLAGAPELARALAEGAQRFGTGAGAAHLISGHSRAHAQLEEALATFTGRPRALLFSTGYMANLGVAQALLGRGDSLVEDRLNHASLLDAAMLSGARLLRYRHCDTASLERRLAQAGGERLVATDAVFSMDGDLAPLRDVHACCEGHDAWLLVDDAHGFGVLGEQGRGACHAQLGAGDERTILMGTLGKALGVSGAFVAGSEALIETLIQFARTYVYTTAASPALAWALLRALALVRDSDARRECLFARVAQFRHGAHERGLPLTDSATPIQPLMLGDAAVAVSVGEALRGEGILTGVIRPPTVPRGGARLRITLSAAHTPADVERLLDALNRHLPEAAHVAH